MHISASAVVVLIALLIAPVQAAQLYKCEGASGETIYQNLPCPNGAKTIDRGSYEPVPDNPSQMRAAAAEANRIRAEQEVAALIYSPAPSATAAPLSASTGVDTTRADEKYRADKARWRTRLAGDKPAGYDDRHPRTAPAAQSSVQTKTYSLDPITRFDPATGDISHGSRDSDGNVTMFNSSTGEFSHGHADGNGNVTLFNQQGVSTTRCDANGVCH